MLLFGAINKLNHVWNNTIQWLSDGILHSQRILAKNQGTFKNTFPLFNILLYYDNQCNYYHCIILKVPFIQSYLG